MHELWNILIVHIIGCSIHVDIFFQDCEILKVIAS